MRQALAFTARLFGSPTFRRAVHTAGVVLVTIAQLIVVWT